MSTGGQLPNGFHWGPLEVHNVVHRWCNRSVEFHIRLLMYQFRHIHSHCSGTHLAYKRHSWTVHDGDPSSRHSGYSLPSSDQDTALYMLGTALPVSHNAMRHLHCGTRYVQTEMCHLHMGPTLPHLGWINPINPNLVCCISVQVHICPNVCDFFQERAHI